MNGLTPQLSLVRRILFFAALLGTLNLAAKPPQWLKTLRRIPVATEMLEDSPDAVILRSGRHTSIDTSGVFRTTISGAILVRDHDGYDAAQISIPYLSDTDKILSFEAWTLPEKGKMVTYRPDDFTDSIAANYKNIITTSRQRSISAKRDMKKNSIFAFEAVVENRDIFSQDRWRFQSDHPTIDSRISFTYPEDWKIDVSFFNTPDVAPTTTTEKGKITQTWRMFNVPAIKPEPLSPTFSEVAKWAAFDIIAPQRAGRIHYPTWRDISVERTPVFTSLATVSPEMEKRVSEITAGLTEEADIIQALAEFAQSINYISVALDLGRGGGYKPRPADEVFETRYGDCKDKTNLLQAMLQLKGIKMHPLIVQSGPEKIFTEWPSPLQFNHCVAAIAVSDEFESPATVQHPALGKLLVFDPTSTFTPFGDIPFSIQDSEGIVLAGQDGGLVKIPQLDLDQSVLEREIEVELFRNGAAVGVIRETSTGQAGRFERRNAFRSEDDYAQVVKNWIARFHPGVEIGEPRKSDNEQNGHFALEVAFKTPNYAKNMRNVLLIFKPLTVDRIDADPFVEQDEARTLPVDLSSYNLAETSQIYLPAGFEISELPENVELEEPFGSYRLEFEATEDAISVHRSVKIHPHRIAVEDFDTLKTFYANRIKADQSTVVLEKP
ncbi:MAG: hypothetical protein SynsKO_30170 [Synoicihabitans sp.]